MEYRLCIGDINTFERSVNILLNKGYKPIGSVQVNEMQQLGNKGEILYALSMIKKPTEEK